MSLLDQIDGPEDVRGLSREELHELVVEARERHVDVTSKVGGHFGASLGVAELTVALHYTFETPRDKLIWDTGHQGYIHKILTGRNERLSTIRQKDGLAHSSGVTSPSTITSVPATRRLRSRQRSARRSPET